ncbi:M24 family metallopeptidase [Anthocerotibacter panamensis]|uniref:M24 family metallopeptidase n=1 Tax=Anthocerotibacter panamensis TaxID=2857077 RepID=UPI001C40274B|nr:M24 family metallopeptidase [Anthocerotibacter panamensis]
MTTSLRFAYRHLPVFTADPQTAQANLETLLGEWGVDCLFITAQDAFLSEYNVPSNNQRYALSNFAGSTGDGIFTSQKLTGQLGNQAQFLLFVDGRYHMQADRETAPEWVQVVKLDISKTLEDGLLGWLKEVPADRLTVAIDGARTTWKRFKQIQTVCEERGFSLRVLLHNEISTALNLPGWSVDRAVEPLPLAATGRTIAGNLTALHQCLPADVTPEAACILTCMSDDVAWLLGARGFHLPYASSLLAYTCTIGRDILLFLPPGTEDTPVHLEPGTDFRLVVLRSLEELTIALRGYHVEHLLFSERAMNAFLPTFAHQYWPEAKLIEDYHGLERLRTEKTPEELAAIRSAFLKSSRAIAATLRWVKASVQLQPGALTCDPTFTAPISEIDLSNKIACEYLAQGALELSFRTIAATGASGAIIHYTTPSPENLLADGDLALLDSGAYYAEGFATDCTRVAYCNSGTSIPAPWQKEIYTVTLKAAIAGLRAEFHQDTPCKEIDAQVRAVCQKYGYDYNHGTGHGVGILVHESGIRLSPISTYGFTEHAVVSIEPGIYLAGKGGVRIENVAVVRRHPTQADHFCFENLAFVGLDWELIDVDLLDAGERAYLSTYERQCQTLGTTVTDCPLLLR